MNSKHKFAVAIATTVLAGTLAIGAAASAAGSGSDTTGTTGTTGSVPARCDKQSAIATRVTTAEQRIEQRLSTLQTKLAKATAAGHTQRATNLQHRIDRLHTLETRIETRYGKYQSWVKVNCPAG